MPFTKNPQGPRKPMVVHCRLTREDFEKFKAYKGGSAQQILEAIIKILIYNGEKKENVI